MKRATVVIGANYGDEGKGRMIDLLASKYHSNMTVVRFNGGAQAGHTVVTPDGQRHVFSHLSSGSFAHARTYLAKHFVCNPVLFWKEYNDFTKLTGNKRVLIAADPRCYITTPYDIILNQLLEDTRGDKRHGSVGVGFGETIERNQMPAFGLTKADCIDEKIVEQKLRNIRDRYFPLRLKQLGLEAPAANDKRMDDRLLKGYVQATMHFNAEVPSAGLEYIARDQILFEGAQGLALDMTHGQFPHVTRSNTGLTNIIPIARVLGLQLDVYYVTRTYVTKHGAGPLAGEFVPPLPIRDETNVPHAYQGKLRFAPLEPGALKERIGRDLKAASGLIHTAELAVTCADHTIGNLDSVLKIPFIRAHWVCHGEKRDDCERR